MHECGGILPLCSLPGRRADIRIPRTVPVEAAPLIGYSAGADTRSCGSAQRDSFPALQHGSIGFLEHFGHAEGQSDCKWTVPGGNGICGPRIGRALPDRRDRCGSLFADVSSRLYKPWPREFNTEVWCDFALTC